MENSTIKDFQILKKLGQGAFGQVYQVRRKIDYEIYAMKKIKMSGLKEKEKDNAINEIRILASLNSQNIIKFKEAFFDPDFGYLCIIMQYASGGDLFNMITSHRKKGTRIKESTIWKAIFDIAKGLKSLHEKKILHRDLKSANIFIGENETYKLGDLNVSKVLKNQMARTQTGTPYYASPQVWNDLPYDSKSDIWSFGCILYEMTSLGPPFKAKDLQELYKKVNAGIFSPIPSLYSAQLSNLISKMLKLNPKQRPSASEILKNPTIKKYFGSFQKEILQGCLKNNSLLETIKFNHKNLRSLKENLPRSAYDEDENETYFTSRKKVSTEESRISARTTSLRQNRMSLHSSPSVEKRMVNEMGRMINPKQYEQNYLPPISSRRQSRLGPSQRLQKVGLEVLQMPRYQNIQRLYSHQ